MKSMNEVEQVSGGRHLADEYAMIWGAGGAAYGGYVGLAWGAVGSLMLGGFGAAIGGPSGYMAGEVVEQFYWCSQLDNLERSPPVHKGWEGF